MADTLGTYLRFFWAGVIRRGQTGSLLPSQRFLIARMIAPVPRDYRGQIIELGAGNGVLTRQLAKRCPKARILACEINPTLARDTRANLNKAGINGQVEVVATPAEVILADMAQRTQKADFVISGIPLGNLDRDRTCALLDFIRQALGEGGMYIQFQHSLLDRKKISDRFSKTRTVPVFLNIPPAVVYYASR